MNFSRTFGLRAVAGLLLAILCVPIASFGVSAAAIGTGYETDDKFLVPGMAVALSAESIGNNTKVERASLDSNSKAVGIATTVEDSLVTVGSSRSQIFVETEGEVEAFVADLNGEVKKGDLITLSPLRGILMRATVNDGSIVAIAAEDFNPQEAESYDIKAANQKATLVQKLKVNLDYKATAANPNSLDSSLEKLGSSIAGKDVGIIRPIIALIIFILIIITEGSILYAAISSTITSVGRNPLARGLIFKELARVMIVVGLVLVVGLASIYGVLLV